MYVSKYLRDSPVDSLPRVQGGGEIGLDKSAHVGGAAACLKLYFATAKMVCVMVC